MSSTNMVCKKIGHPFFKLCGWVSHCSIVLEGVRLVTSITKKKREGNKGSPSHRPYLAMKNEEELAFTNREK